MTNPVLILIFTKGLFFLFPYKNLGKEDDIDGIANGIFFSGKFGGASRTLLLLGLIHAASIRT